MLQVGAAFALAEARLLSQSASGKTAVFNLGIHDGVTEGDYAVVVKEIRSYENRDLRLIPIARAKNIKINPDSSVWVLYKVFDASLLVKDHKFLILSETEMLRGRRDPRLGRIKVVAEKGKATEAAQNNLADDKNRLSKLKDKYQKVENWHDEEASHATDGTLIDLEEWEKVKGEKYRTALFKSPHQDDFRRDMRLQTFEKLVTGYLRKVNEPGFNYDSFYDDQMKDDFSNHYKKHSNFDTEYESFLKDQKSSKITDIKLKRSLLEKGDNWSEDYSDEELGRTLNKVSVLQEKDRREFLLSNPNRYTVILDYGMGITDTQTDNDPYRRDSRYSLELDFEAIPFLKHQTLERFTLHASVRSNKTALETSNSNASVDETSISLGANWYPLYVPYAVESPVIFLGTFMRSGWASIEAPTIGEKANYTVLSLPGFLAGLRYNFRSGVGLRVVGSLETLQLERFQSNKLVAVLPDRTNLVDGKMGFGFLYSF